jgi:hypothetical protein
MKPSFLSTVALAFAVNLVMIAIILQRRASGVIPRVLMSLIDIVDFD